MLKYRRVINVDNPSSIPLMDESRSFWVKSVKVDNYSGHWLRIDPDTQFCPPFTAGMLIDMYVQTQNIKVFSARPTGIGIQSGATELDGIAIISVYDEPVYPFPGTYVAQPFIQRIDVPGMQGTGDILPALPATFTPIQMTYSFPLNWAAADNNESNEHIQARQVIYWFSEELVCAAGVQTDFTFHPAADAQRIMVAAISTDTSGEVVIDYSSGANDPIYRGFLMAGNQVVIPFMGNGLNLNGTNTNEFQAIHDVGGRVYLNVGMART